MFTLGAKLFWKVYLHQYQSFNDFEFILRSPEDLIKYLTVKKFIPFESLGIQQKYINALKKTTSERNRIISELKNSLNETLDSVTGKTIVIYC